MKILMVNCFQGGAEIAYSDLRKRYEKEGNIVDYVDLYRNLNFIPKKVRFITAKVITPFYALARQMVKSYDKVIMNQNIVIPIGRNFKCRYENIIHHPYICDMRDKEKVGLIDFFFLFNEKFSVLFCKNIITESIFSKNNILEEYPNVNCIIIPVSINQVFYEAKEKYNEKKKVIFLPNIYCSERKGGNFITPVMLKLAPLLQEYEVEVMISNKVIASQQDNYKKLRTSCNLTSIGFVSYEEIAKLYATSLMVLTPATLEGYGLVPLEVEVSGGKCISAPFPSLVEGKKNTNVIVLEHNEKLWYDKIKEVIEGKI